MLLKLFEIVMYYTGPNQRAATLIETDTEKP